jgi:uncharacterized membrane protein
MTSARDRRAPATFSPRFQLIAFLAFLITAVIPFSALFIHCDPLALCLGLTILLASAMIFTLIFAARSLPIQNVLSAAILIALLSSLFEYFSIKPPVPFGPPPWQDNLGPRLFHLVPWPLPFIWVVNILTSRGFARFLLRPCQNLPYYGFVLLGCTALLVTIFNAVLDHFAKVNPIWIFPDAESAPSFNFLSHGIAALLIVAFVTPWLINKRPGPKPPVDYYAPVVWLLLLGILAGHCNY